MQLEQLQQKLGYTFRDVSWLKQALTHKSFGRDNYERLEFVGDGILDYVIALNLFQKYPHLPEGELSKMRSALVNQDVLKELALDIGVGQYLYLGDGEEKSQGRTRASILADSIEAIIAAISLDSSFNEARLFIERLYTDKFGQAENLTLKDSKSLLQELLQSRHIEVPRYTVLEAIGPEHDSIFRVECSIVELRLKVLGQGKTKKEASQIAAAAMLKLVKNAKN
jgi:ribonuclease-3